MKSKLQIKKLCCIVLISLIALKPYNIIDAQQLWAGAPKGKGNGFTLRKGPMAGLVTKKNNSSPIMDGVCGLPALNPCIPEAICVPSVPIIGEALCKCPDGYSGDGRKDGSGCVNIDECRSGIHDCDSKTMDCVDLQGTYECKCKPGYGNSPSGKICLDVNECYDSTLNNCDPASMTCRNLEGSYQCDCKDPNQVMDENTKICRDLNECSDLGGAMNPCQQICINRNPGVECACQPGFKLSRDKRTCDDINECLDPMLHTCDPVGRVSQCVNTFGSYYCECNNNLGFRNTDDGQACGNYNECEAYPYICGGARSCCKDLAPPERFACIVPSDANLDAISNEIREAGGFVMPFSDVSDLLTDTFENFSPLVGMSLEQELDPSQFVNSEPDHQLSMGVSSMDYFSDMLKDSATFLTNDEYVENNPGQNETNYVIFGNGIDLKELDDILNNKLVNHATSRSLQLLPSLFTSGQLQVNRGKKNSNGISPAGFSGLRGIRGGNCPPGFSLGADLQRSKTRKATMQAVQSALFSNSRDSYGDQKPVNPQELTDSIVKNTAVVSKELQKWITELSSVPQEIARAADPITNAQNPQRQSLTLGETPLSGGGLVPGFNLEDLASLLIGGGIGKLIECDPANDPFCDRTGKSRDIAYGS